MGTAILTNLNGMTNPPSDLNEITTGWKFFKSQITIPPQNQEFQYPTTQNVGPTGLSGTFPKIVLDGIPKNCAGLAIMISTATPTHYEPSNLFPLKQWPSNPTTDNILDETNYPLNVIFDQYTLSKESPTNNGNAITDNLKPLDLISNSYGRHKFYASVKCTLTLSVQESSIQFSFMSRKLVLIRYDSDRDRDEYVIYPESGASYRLQQCPSGSYTVGLGGFSRNIYGWYLPA